MKYKNLRTGEIGDLENNKPCLMDIENGDILEEVIERHSIKVKSVA